MSRFLPGLKITGLLRSHPFPRECDINLNNNKRNGRHEGLIGILGTRRGFRKQGLGRAMLLTGLRCLKAEGMEIAKLGVDSQNPSGALGLYESVGFEKIYSNILFVKDILINR